MDDLNLKDGIAAIILQNSYNPIIQDIAQNIYDNGLDPNYLKLILKKHLISKITDIKDYALPFIVDYIRMALNDYVITENEVKNITLLKFYFKIKQGDFFKYRYYDVVEILYNQFDKIYEDKTVTYDEEITKVELQGLFDLSYDQFYKINQEYLANKTQKV